MKYMESGGLLVIKSGWNPTLIVDIKILKLLQKKVSDYHFIIRKESLKKFLLVPFDVKEILKSKVFCQLLVAATINQHPDRSKEYKYSLPQRILNIFDISYLASTAEESLYRGWILPVAHYELLMKISSYQIVFKPPYLTLLNIVIVINISFLKM